MVHNKDARGGTPVGGGGPGGGGVDPEVDHETNSCTRGLSKFPSVYTSKYVYSGVGQDSSMHTTHERYLGLTGGDILYDTVPHTFIHDTYKKWHSPSCANSPQHLKKIGLLARSVYRERRVYVKRSRVETHTCTRHTRHTLRSQKRTSSCEYCTM